jgi:hypothetical protein
MSREFRILFVGNSYTTRNDMPAMLKDLLSASVPDIRIEAEVIAFGGASLAAHWNQGLVQKRLTDQKWDAVVLQDQSTRPLRALKSMQEHVHLFVRAIQASGAKPYLYMTWARKSALESQGVITKAYEDLALETGARVIPVGVFWQQARKINDELELYDPDGSHPSIAGSYLSACSHFTSLFGMEPAESAKMEFSLSEKDRIFIRKLCWKHATIWQIPNNIFAL